MSGNLTLPGSVLDMPWVLPRTIETTTLYDDAPLAQAPGLEPGDYIECITWHDASKPARPDAELTVLLATTSPGMPIDMGWWDGERWCLCESGGFAAPGSVLAWAEVEGPELA